MKVKITSNVSPTTQTVAELTVALLFYTKLPNTTGGNFTTVRMFLVKWSLTAESNTIVKAVSLFNSIIPMSGCDPRNDKVVGDQ